MKTRMLAPRKVAENVKTILTQDFRFQRSSPLELAAEELQRNRDYSWVGIYVAVEDAMHSVARGSQASSGSESLIAVQIKIGARTLGMLEVESSGRRDHEDRLLLKRVAALLARFLVTKGKYLRRKLREQTAEAAQNEAAARRGYQPASERAESLRAAAGESARK